MMQLGEAQLGFFARNGFLHVPGLIGEDTCRKLVDHTWTRMPPQWVRNDSSSWAGALPDSCHIADLKVRRGLLQFQKGDLLGNATIEGAFSSTAIGGELGRALIGHPLANMRVRGLYCIVPLDDSITYPGAIAKPHIESHPAQLIALCYLDEVARGGGGLHVWPGSHRDIYPAMGSRLEHVATPRYDTVFAKWARLEPLELPGHRGDIVIIHHRLLHAPSVNRTRNIRYGFLCDYQRDDFRDLCAMPPGLDLWEDWPAIAKLPPQARNGPSDFRLRDQGGWVDKVPLHAKGYRLSVAHTADTDPSSVRKADASALARSRREGETWLALSDDPGTAKDTELFPRGSDLGAAGVSVRVDGSPLRSLCQYDIIARLDSSPGDHVIEVEGLQRVAWLRILMIRLPFIRTEFLLKSELRPGRNRLRFTVPGRALSGLV
ncbi:MAG: phytanoyl-CoA dioxygenase family protein [Ramlibacter sp.]